jgi:hypothetical protein
MKKLLNIALVCATALGAATFTDCDKGGGDDGDKQIELPNKNEEIQQGYADDETTGGFTFTAKSVWTATVKETTTRAASSGVSWLRLLYEGQEKYDGEAGTFTLAIEIDLNYTGTTRSATITITSGTDKITVTVTQDGKTNDGGTPPPPEPFDRTITGQLNATDGENITGIKALHSLDKAVLVAGTINAGNFSITLPEKVESGNLHPFNVQGNVPVSDPAANHTSVSLEVYIANGKNVGHLGYDKAGVQYIYVDRDCRVTGSGEEDGANYTYNVSLKKGWNTVYEVLNGNVTEFTTTRPNGDLVWRVSFYITTGTRLLREMNVEYTFNVGGEYEGEVYKSTSTFSYDDRDRLTSVHEDYDDKFPGETVFNVSYPNAVTAIITSGSGEHDTFTVTLDAGGRATKAAISGTEMTFAYDTGGYLATAKQSSYTYEFIWNAGNLVNGRWQGSPSNFSETDIAYSHHPNNRMNIDLNCLSEFPIDLGGSDWSGDEEGQILIMLRMLGLLGNRSENLAANIGMNRIGFSQSVLEDGEGNPVSRDGWVEKSDVCTFTLNREGYVMGIERKIRYDNEKYTYADDKTETLDSKTNIEILTLNYDM